MEQPVARLAHNQEVEGSNPSPATYQEGDGQTPTGAAEAPPAEAAPATLRDRALANLWPLQRFHDANGERQREDLIAIEIGRLRFLDRVQAPR